MADKKKNPLDQLLEDIQKTSPELSIGSVPQPLKSAFNIYDTASAATTQSMIDMQNRINHSIERAAELQSKLASASGKERGHIQERLLSAEEARDRYTSEFNIYKDQYSQQNKDRFYSNVSQMISPESVTSMSRAYGAQASSYNIHSMAKNIPFHEARDRMVEAQQAIAGFRYSAEETLRTHGPENQFGREQLIYDVGGVQRHAQQIGILDQVMRAQARMGRDPMSRDEAIYGFERQFEKSQFKFGVQQDVKAGKYGNINQEMEKLAEIANKVAESLKEFGESTGKTEDEIENLRKSVELNREAYEKQKEVVNQVEAGGGGRNNWRTGASMLGGAASVFGAASSAVYGIGVANEVADMNNRIAKVNIANSRYTDFMAASQMDAGALRRIMTDQYSTVVAAGNDIRTEAAISAGFEIASGIFNTGAEVITGAVKGSAKGGKTGAIAGGLSAGAGSAASTANRIHALYKGIPQDQAAITMTNLNNSLLNAMSMVDDSSVQQAIDYRTGLMQATRGMGGTSIRPPLAADRGFRSDRNQTILSMQDPAVMARLAGLNASERNQLLAQGVGALGHMMGGERGISIMETGQQFARSGYLQSAGQFIGMTQRLTGASGDENLTGKILRSAIKEGMSDSVVLNQLVGSIGKLSDAAAALGSVAGEGMANRLITTAGAFKDMGYSNQQSVLMATSGRGLANQIATSGALSTENMVRFAAARNTWGSPKNDLEQLEFMRRQTMSFDDMSNMRNLQNQIDTAKDPGTKKSLQDQMSKLQRQLGVNMSGQDISKLQDIQTDVFVNKYFGYLDKSLHSRAREEIKSGKISPEIEKALINIGALKGEQVLGAAYSISGKTFDTKTGASIDEPIGEGGVLERTNAAAKSIADKAIQYGTKKLHPDTIEEAYTVGAKLFNPELQSKQAKDVGKGGDLPERQGYQSFEELKNMYEKTNTLLGSIAKHIETMNEVAGVSSTKFEGSVQKFEKVVNAADFKHKLTGQSK